MCPGESVLCSKEGRIYGTVPPSHPNLRASTLVSLDILLMIHIVASVNLREDRHRRRESLKRARKSANEILNSPRVRDVIAPFFLSFPFSFPSVCARIRGRIRQRTDRANSYVIRRDSIPDTLKAASKRRSAPVYIKQNASSRFTIRRLCLQETFTTADRSIAASPRL